MTVSMTFVAVICSLLGLAAAWQSNNAANSAVIVISAPQVANTYYTSVYDTVIQFQAEYARLISEEGSNSVVILADSSTRTNLLALGVPDDIIAVAEIEGVWIRDFGLVGVTQQVKYKYQPNYLSLADARTIQNSLFNFFASIGISPKKTKSLVLDGGNVVDNGVDTAIVTERIYFDRYNYINYYDDEIENLIKTPLGYSTLISLKEVAGDTTGHSDGMVSFLDQVNVAISDLPPNLYNPIKAQIEYNGFTEVYLNSTYVDEEWNGFGSACGLHVNLLAVGSALYVPTFGDDPQNTNQSPQKDKEILEVIENAVGSTKSVTAIPVPHDVCKMGGSVRCLTMAMDGENANTLIQYAAND